MAYVEYHNETKLVVAIYEDEPSEITDEYSIAYTDKYVSGDEFELSIYINEVDEESNVTSDCSIKNNPNAKFLLEENSKLKEQIQILSTNADDAYKNADKVNTDTETLRYLKIQQLKYLCTNDIYNGFTSSVVNEEGFAYEFGFNQHDQQNFDQQYLLIVSGDNNAELIKWKTLNFGIVEFKEDEFKQIIYDATYHKVTMQSKYWMLESQVLSATTNEEIDKVNWD